MLLNHEPIVGLVAFLPITFKSFSSLWTFIISFVSTFGDFFSKTCFDVSVLVVDGFQYDFLVLLILLDGFENDLVLSRLKFGNRDSSAWFSFSDVDCETAKLIPSQLIQLSNSDESYNISFSIILLFKLVYHSFLHF